MSPQTIEDIMINAELDESIESVRNMSLVSSHPLFSQNPPEVGRVSHVILRFSQKFC